MPIAPVLQRFIDDELSQAPALIEQTLDGALALLRASKDETPASSAERKRNAELIAALQSHAATCERAFVEALVEGVRETTREQEGALPAPTPGGGLALMDESQVEVDIEISRALQLIDTTAEWELRELQTFTSTLTGQTHVSNDSNPLRPQVYAAALWQAACAASAEHAQRAVLLRVLAGVAAKLLKKAWAAACTRLESQGVEPGIYRTVLLPSGTAGAGRGTPAPEAGRNGALPGLLVSMPGGTAAPGGAAPNPHAAAAQPGASAGLTADRQVMELVGRIFNAMLADRHLPVAFIAVLARLQASALRVALREPEMAGSTQHAVWQLLDRIGEAAAACRHAADPRAAALLSGCLAIVEPLANATHPDSALYKQALSRLDAFLDEQRQSRLRAAQSTVQALQQSERRALLEQQLSQRLVDQAAAVRTTPVVRRFITGTWARVLAEAMLQDGEQADTTRGYIKLVDELLWSVQLPDHPQSRQRLLALLPSLLGRLRAGMATIGLPAAEQSSVLDELVAIHTDALRPGKRSDATLTPSQIVQRLRDEVLPAATGHGGFSDSVIDLGSMETVPAALMENESAAAGDDATARVAALRAGERRRLFLLGRWHLVQLLWRSEHGLYLLFAGETAAATHSITRRALERLASAGLMQAPAPRTLVQRAVDAVARDVAARA